MPNEYSDAAATVAGGSDVGLGADTPVSQDNDYAAAARQVVGNARVGINLAAQSAADIDPERHGKVLAIADRTKLPPSVVESQFDTLTKHLQTTDADLAGINRDHPGLGKWLSDRDNAAIGKDDLGNLKQMDAIIRQMTAPAEDPNHILPPGFRFNQRGAIEQMQGGNVVAVYKTPRDLASAISTQAGEQGQAFFESQTKAENLRKEFGPLGPAYLGFRRNATSTLGLLGLIPQGEAAQWNQALTQTRQGLPTTGAAGFMTDVQEALGGVGADMPLMALGGPFASGMKGLLEVQSVKSMLARKLGAKGAEYATGALETAAAVQPLAAREGLQDAQQYGTLAGIMSYLVETAVPGAFGRTGVEKAFIPGIERMTERGWAPAAKRLLFEAGMEASEESTTELAHAMHEVALGSNPNALDGNQLFRRMALAGVVGGIAGGAFNIPEEIAGKVFHEAGQANVAERNGMLLQAMGEAIGESKTAKRSASRLQQLIANSTGEQSGAIYFSQSDWSEHWTDAGQDPEAVAKALGVDEAQYQAAQASNGIVAVPLDSFLAKVGPTKSFTALQSKAKLSPDGMSFDESKAWQENLPGLVKAAQEAAAQTPTNDIILKQATDQLVSLGYSPQAAEDSASLLGFFNVLANRWNKGAEARGAKPLDPVEMFNQYGLQIKKDQGELPHFSELDLALDRLRAGKPPANETETQLASVVQQMGMDLTAADNATVKKALQDQGVEKTGQMIEAAQSGQEFAQSALTPDERKIEQNFRSYLTNSQEEAVARYEQNKETQSGRIIAADEVKKLSEDFIKDGTLAGAVHEPSSDFADLLYERALAQPPTQSVVFMAGGGGSGKTTSLAKVGLLDGESIIFDSIFGTYEKARDKIELALKSGREVDIIFVYSPIENAIHQMVSRAIKTNRTLPLGDAVVKHYKAQQTVLKLASEYKGKADVAFTVIDNSGTKEQISQKSLGWLESKRYPSPVDVKERAANAYQNERRLLSEPQDRAFTADFQQAGQAPVEFGGSPDSGTQGGNSAGREGTGGDPGQAGQELNQRAGKDAGGRRGSIRISPERKFTINLTESADPSTFLHETFHFNLEVLGDLATRADAPQDIKDDYQAVLDWMGVKNRNEIGTVQHEQWARAGEAYVMENKAPSSALRRVFSRLSQWLVSIYRNLKSLNVKLSPEVRGVMDRLLASEEEIQSQENDEVGTPLFTNAAEAGMTPERFVAYAKLAGDAATHARDTMRMEIMDEVNREKRAWWKAQKATVEQKVSRDVMSRRDYIALSIMQKSVLPNGDALPEGAPKIKLDKKELVDLYGEEFVKRLPKGITAVEGASSLAAAADLFGYASPDEMVMAMANVLPQRQQIARETNQQMLAEHSDLRFNGEAVAKAEEAVRGPKRSDVIEMELKILRTLQRENKPVEQAAKQAGIAEGAAAAESKGARELADERLRNSITEMQLALRVQAAKGEVKQAKQAAKADKQQTQAKAREIATNVPPAELFREAARQTVGSMRVASVRPRQFLKASREAAREAFLHLGAGRFGQAAAAKERELLNTELYQAALQAQKDVAKAVTFLKRFERDDVRAKLGTAGADYLEQVDDLLARYDLSKTTQKSLDRRSKLRQWVADQEAKGIPTGVPQEVIDDTRQINYQELNVDFLMAVRDAVKAIQHTAAFKNKLLKSHDGRQFDEAVNAAVDATKANIPPLPPEKIASERTRWDKFKARIWGFLASHRKLAEFAREMDGEKSGGANWSLLIRGLNEAADQEVEMRKDAATAQTELWKAWREGGGKLTDKAMIHSIGKSGQSLNLETRLMTALNWGNEGNRERLMRGENWNEGNVQEILSTLSKNDWTLVQGVLDHIESFWPEIAAKQKRVTGLEPEKVEAAPIQTKYGVHRGGYFPISYDSNLSPKSSQQEAATVGHLYAMGAATRGTTKRGHTEARQGGTGKPLKLDLDVLSQHLGQVIHDLTHHETVIDMNRILNDERFSETVQNHLGPAALREMRSTVKDVAVSDLAENDVDKMLRRIRNGVSVATLGFNLGTVAMQLTGIGQSMQRVGVPNFLSATMRIMGDASKMENKIRWITEKSDFMASRIETANRETREVLGQVKDGLGFTGNISKWSMYLMMRSQQLVDAPTWLAEYESAQTAGHNEEKSVAMADQAVRDSQGSGLTADLAGVQRSRITQLLTVFYSYFNSTLNRSIGAVNRFRHQPWSAESSFRLGLDMLLLYSVPAAMSVLIRRTLKGGSNDQKKTLGGDLLKEHLSMLMGTLVGLREFSGAVTDSYGYRGPAGTAGFDAVNSLILQAKQGEFDKGLITAAAKAAGYTASLFGVTLPTGVITRTIDGLMYDAQHHTSDPRPLLFGPPPKSK